MQGYLSISDFARLRNVNPKSLRYYERIGALIPAYTDPQTGYRYYALEQLVEMDMILMCLELNIPLRDAEQYRQPDQTLDILHLLQDGQQKALEKLAHLHGTLRQMEEALRRIEENRPYQKRDKAYRRHLRPRFVLREPFSLPGGELAFKQSSAEIFLHGQSLGLLPAFTFPIGLIARQRNGRVEADIFLEVLQQENRVAGLDILPAGEYRCRQEPEQALEHMDSLLSEYFLQHPRASQVIVTNLTSDCFDRKGSVLELQEPV